MPGAIHNYWLGIMALAFVLALVLWISLVFYAERHPGGQAQEHTPRGDVTGGSFIAAEGGRQVTPDPRKAPSGEYVRPAAGNAQNSANNPPEGPPAPVPAPRAAHADDAAHAPTAHPTDSKGA
jgi:hypothetical protein